MPHQPTRPTKAMRTLGWMGLRLDSELGALGLQLLADRASGFRPVSGPTISAQHIGIFILIATQQPNLQSSELMCTHACGGVSGKHLFTSPLGALHR